MSVINVNEQNFEQEVLSAEQLVMVDFWAPWCGPCQMLGPIIEEVAKENTQIKVAKLNVDEAISIAQKYGVASIPTVLVFKNGQEVNRSMGFVPKESIVKLIEQ